MLKTASLFLPAPVFQTMINTPLRNACRRFTEDVCGHAIVCACGSFFALWLLASVTLLPVGIGLYVGYDKHIGTILMSVGGVCLCLTIVYALCLKFFEYYHEEVRKEAQQNRVQRAPQPAPEPVQVTIPPVVPPAPVQAPVSVAVESV